jgi:hypothetical protein
LIECQFVQLNVIQRDGDLSEEHWMPICGFELLRTVVESWSRTSWQSFERRDHFESFATLSIPNVCFNPQVGSEFSRHHTIPLGSGSGNWSGTPGCNRNRCGINVFASAKRLCIIPGRIGCDNELVHCQYGCIWFRIIRASGDWGRKCRLVRITRWNGNIAHLATPYYYWCDWYYHFRVSFWDLFSQSSFWVSIWWNGSKRKIRVLNTYITNAFPASTNIFAHGSAKSVNWLEVYRYIPYF